MFTGLIEELGIIKSITKRVKSAQIIIRAKKVLHGIKLGDSICTNGVCLTVISFNDTSFTVDIMPETMKRSNLNNVKHGEKVNLERAMNVGGRLGGHILTGHIDGVGAVKEFKKEDNATWITVEADDEVLKYIVKKGSIAVDGVSLTVAYLGDDYFKVSLIPLTANETTLLIKKVGDKVNLECDIIGKYVERLLFLKNDIKKNNIDKNFLRENGFL